MLIAGRETLEISNSGKLAKNLDFKFDYFRTKLIKQRYFLKSDFQWLVVNQNFVSKMNFFDTVFEILNLSNTSYQKHMKFKYLPQVFNFLKIAQTAVLPTCIAV